MLPILVENILLKYKTFALLSRKKYHLATFLFPFTLAPPHEDLQSITDNQHHKSVHTTGYDMPTPIIMAAFGTSPAARATYQIIDQQVQNYFREHLILWSYAPRSMNIPSGEREPGSFQHHLEAIQAISDKGYRQAAVQSLHLLPGQEFHRYFLECQQAALPCSLGMPALFRPEDYQKLADCLEPIILSRPDKAILLLGHGTSHPIWVAYNALESIFRRRFGRRIFVGVME